jgi:hypothetical protein
MTGALRPHVGTSPGATHHHVGNQSRTGHAPLPCAAASDANDPEQTLGVRCEMSCLAGSH